MTEKKNHNEAKEKLEKLLNGMDADEQNEASPFDFLAGKAGQNTPVQDAAGPDKSSAEKNASPAKSETSSFMGGDLAVKLKKLEDELGREKEKALKAEVLLKERENVRLEMENIFRNLKDQLQNDRIEKEMENERLNARARVEVLEKRLGEMNQLLLEVLKEQKKNPAEAFPQDILKDFLNRQNEALALLGRKEEEHSKLLDEFVAAIREKDEKIKHKDAELARLSTELQDTVKNSERNAAIKYENLLDGMKKELVERNKEIAGLAAYKESYEKAKEENNELRKLVGQEGLPLKDLVKILRNDIEIYKREAESLKISLAEAQDRHKRAYDEKKALLVRLDEMESSAASGRLRSLPDDIEKLEKIVLNIMSSPGASSDTMIEFMQKSLADREEELSRIRENINRLKPMENPPDGGD